MKHIAWNNPKQNMNQVAWDGRSIIIIYYNNIDANEMIPFIHLFWNNTNFHGYLWK